MDRHFMDHRVNDGSGRCVGLPRCGSANGDRRRAPSRTRSRTASRSAGCPTRCFAARKDELVEIPLSYLRQPPPPAYLLDSGDVLGVFIEGVLGDKNQAPPVRFFTESEAARQRHAFRPWAT